MAKSRAIIIMPGGTLIIRSILRSRSRADPVSSLDLGVEQAANRKRCAVGAELQA